MKELIQFAKRHKYPSLALWVIAIIFFFLAFSLQPHYYRLSGQIKLPRIKNEGIEQSLFSSQVIDNWIKKELPRQQGAKQYKKILPTITTDFMNNNLIVKFSLSEQDLKQAAPFLQLIANGLTAYAKHKKNLFIWEEKTAASKYRQQANLIRKYYITPMIEALNQYYIQIFNPSTQKNYTFFNNSFKATLPTQLVFNNRVIRDISVQLAGATADYLKTTPIHTMLFVLNNKAWQLDQEATRKLQQIHGIQTHAFVQPPILKKTAERLPLIAEILFILLLGSTLAFLVLCVVFYVNQLTRILLNKS